VGRTGDSSSTSWLTPRRTDTCTYAAPTHWRLGRSRGTRATRAIVFWRNCRRDPAGRSRGDSTSKMLTTAVADTASPDSLHAKCSFSPPCNSKHRHPAHNQRRHGSHAPSLDSTDQSDPRTCGWGKPACCSESCESPWRTMRDCRGSATRRTSPWGPPRRSERFSEATRRALQLSPTIRP
jgi:hypothetical protein